MDDKTEQTKRTENSTADVVDITRRLIQARLVLRLGHELRCSVCGGTKTRCMPPGIKNVIVVCDGCGHMMWFTITMPQDERVEGIDE